MNTWFSCLSDTEPGLVSVRPSLTRCSCQCLTDTEPGSVSVSASGDMPLRLTYGAHLVDCLGKDELLGPQGVQALACQAEPRDCAPDGEHALHPGGQKGRKTHRATHMYNEEDTLCRTDAGHQKIKHTAECGAPSAMGRALFTVCCVLSAKSSVRWKGGSSCRKF